MGLVGEPRRISAAVVSRRMRRLARENYPDMVFDDCVKVGQLTRHSVTADGPWSINLGLALFEMGYVVHYSYRLTANGSRSRYLVIEHPVGGAHP